MLFIAFTRPSLTMDWRRDDLDGGCGPCSPPATDFARFPRHSIGDDSVPYHVKTTRFYAGTTHLSTSLVYTEHYFFSVSVPLPPFHLHPLTCLGLFSSPSEGDPTPLCLNTRLSLHLRLIQTFRRFPRSISLAHSRSLAIAIIGIVFPPVHIT